MRLPSAAISATLLATLIVSGPARAESGAGAMRLYRDPTTGVIGAPPAQEPVAARALAVEAPPDDLVREPLNAPGGGTKVRVPSRLRAAVTRQAGADAGHECVQSGSARE